MNNSLVTKLILLILFFPHVYTFSQNQNSIVQNVRFEQRKDSSFVVDVYYDVNDPESSTMTITMKVSVDDTTKWDFACTKVTGDVGENIANGTNKHIVWDFGTEHPNYSGDSIRIKIIAESVPQPPILVSPIFNATDQSITLTLTWKTSSGANSYSFQVSSNPDFLNPFINQTGITTTSKQISKLLYATPYYWRVNATNNYGTSGWSGYWSFSTVDTVFVCGKSTISYSDMTYHTVQIGAQCWLKENLNVGTLINGNLDQTSGNGIEKYCYNDNQAYCDTFGGLYQWNEAMQYVTTEGARGICPTGWHIPKYINVDFEALMIAVNYDANALKKVGQDSTATDSSGFSVLLAGYRYENGYFSYLGNNASLWSSTANNATYVYFMDLHYNNSFINFNIFAKNNGLSVRCVQD
jgi:uncharacterized protein (TIGR02145 family)